MANRFLINKSNQQQQIEWNLIIYNLKLNDSGHYICQLNVPPFDSQGLNRFHLEVYGMLGGDERRKTNNTLNII